MLGCWQNSSHNEDVSTLTEVFARNNYNFVGVSETYDIESAEKAIKNADVVIFTCGEFSEQSGEAHSRQNLHLTKEEIVCYQYLKSKTPNIISLIFGGRPLIINEIDEGAIVYCWHLGHRTAEAIEKLLSGECNFSGKLAVTIPKDEGQIPIYYAKKKLGRPYDKENTSWRFQAKYEDGENEPAYVFGYGLSYSKFTYKNLRIDKDVLLQNEQLKVCIDVENTSDCDGTEIVQLYLGDLLSEVIRPTKELKAFKRVNIKAKEQTTVEFALSEKDLRYYHSNGDFKVDEGQFEVFVGESSGAIHKLQFYYKEA